jgi:hypothetical protein
METARWERLAGAGGILLTLLAIFGHDILAGEADTLPMRAPPAEIAAKLASRPLTAQVWAGWYVELLGFLAFVFFLASLWSLLKRAEGEPATLSGIAFGGGLLAVGLKFVSAVPVIAAYSRGQEAFDPQVLAVLVDMGNAAFVLTLAFAVHAGKTRAPGRRARLARPVRRRPARCLARAARLDARRPQPAPAL